MVPDTFLSFKVTVNFLGLVGSPLSKTLLAMVTILCGSPSQERTTIPSLLKPALFSVGLRIDFSFFFFIEHNLCFTNSNESPSHTNDPITSSTGCLASNQKNSRFGETLHFADLDGNGVTDVIVGAPRYGTNLEGSVYIQYR